MPRRAGVIDNDDEEAGNTGKIERLLMVTATHKLPLVLGLLSFVGAPVLVMPITLEHTKNIIC